MPIAKMLLGTLLHGGSETGDNYGGHDHEEVDGDEDSTLGLRIGAIFAILAAGLIGAVPPLIFMVFQDQGSPMSRFFRAFAGGVILALALVHILPEGLAEIDSLAAYTYGGPIVAAGVVFMIIVESSCNMLMSDGTDVESQLPESPTKPSNGALPSVTMDDPAHNCLQSHKAASFMVSFEDRKPGTLKQQPPAVSVNNHTHNCLRGHRASSWLVSFEDRKTGALKQQVSAYMFELGCVTHSFIIGLMLGTQVTNKTKVSALVIALCFHQAIEGLSLGNSVGTAGFSRLKSFSMVFFYALTVPIGTAVGIAVASSYDGQSITAIAVQGVFNCLSGGMLLYIALVQLLGDEFRSDDKQPVSIHVRLGTYAALISGLLCMCVVAKWA
eukprot:gene14510-20538_t